jgi:uncharacterized protein YbjT (DUF2867 family)
VVRLELNDAASVTAAVQGVDAVYLAAPGDFPPEPGKRLIDAAKQAGVKKVVMLSAMGVDAAPQSPLRQVEVHLEGSGLAWTTWFKQNFSTSHAQSIRAGVLAETAGDKKTAFIDTRDIAAVAAKALLEDGHAGKTYTLTGPELLSRGDVAGTLSKTLGRDVRYHAITDEQFREAMKPRVSASYLELLSRLYAGVRQGWTERTSDDVQRVLGRAPIAFAQFARDHRAIWS